MYKSHHTCNVGLNQILGPSYRLGVRDSVTKRFVLVLFMKQLHMPPLINRFLLGFEFAEIFAIFDKLLTV